MSKKLSPFARQVLPVPAQSNGIRGETTVVQIDAYEQFMVDPFEVEVTEITADVRRLHNHIHFNVRDKL